MPADFCTEQSPADQHQAESGLSPAETGPSSVLIAVKVTLFSLEFGGSSSDSPLYVEFPAQNKILFTIIQLKTNSRTNVGQTGPTVFGWRLYGAGLNIKNCVFLRLRRSEVPVVALPVVRPLSKAPLQYVSLSQRFGESSMTPDTCAPPSGAAVSLMLTLPVGTYNNFYNIT